MDKVGKLSPQMSFQTVQRLANGLLNELKQMRVPGEPQDFVDCYLDEIDKVFVQGFKFSLKVRASCLSLYIGLCKSLV